MKTCCETLEVEELDDQIIEAMWGLFKAHYDGVVREVFERDLRQKQKALVLWRDGRVIGFTSMRFSDVDEHCVIYSGDVVVAAEARDAGTAHFFNQWALAVWGRCDWWCALSGGPRTFRIAHTFFKRVTPGPAVEESGEEHRLRERFAEHAYGAAYDRATGVVRLPHPYTLKAADQRLREDYPMDRYFQSVNPGWRQGDESVSLISLEPENWRRVALRMLYWKGGHG